ncbi:hypothetical protein DFS33DRAFT_1387755 [Desarmillaria ectypa]|nr:hypothetical protein DFS33DRAFT_1388821 [Desarmillaria ectypa]KAK0200536.1 hypothetical protein DFS33DRAFT_1387755 [Desarmillaria ectypa]
MPMTILWALEHLNEGDAWSMKETLTIHLVLYGLQLPNLMKPWSSNVMITDTCSDCKIKSRDRLHEHRRKLYHELGANPAFENPELAVAFNSGLSQESAGTWPDTIKFLVGRKLPSIFTAYNCREAESDAKILTRCGARLVSSSDLRICLLA